MKKKKIKISLERDKDKIMVFVKTPKEFEDFFKDLSKGEIKTSNCWLDREGNGAKFYALTSDYEKLEKDANYDTFNDFGDGLIKNNKVNLAMLRTIGASEGVYLASEKFISITNMDFERYIRELGSSAKNIWNSFISKKKLRAIITFEI